MDTLKEYIGEENAANLMRELETFNREFKNLGWKEARPWKEFFAVFKPPQQWKLAIIQERMETNFLQYRTNYLYIILVILVFDVITSPFIAFMIIVAVILFLGVSAKDQIQIGETSFQGKEKLYLAGGLSGLLLLLTGVLMNILTTLAIALSIVSLHMLFRPRDLNSKYNKLKQKFREEMSGSKSVDDVDIEGGESKRPPSSSDTVPLYTNVALEQRKGGNVVPSAM